MNAHVGFHAQALRNEFNRHLKQFIKLKKDQAIIANYIGDIQHK